MQYRAPERRYIGERGAAVKRFLCVLMTLVLLLGSGQAEFAPLFSALDQYSEEGNALLWQLSASVTELPDASDAAMEALGGLLEKVSLSFITRGGDTEESAIQMAYDGETVLNVRTRKDEHKTHVQWDQEVYVTDQGTPDALEALLGSESRVFPRVHEARESLWAQLKNLYAVLSANGVEGELVKATTSIKDVGASGRYIPYRLNEAEMNAAWQQMQPLLTHVYDLLGVHMSVAEQVTFAGDTEIRRIRDKEENDWGFSVTTHVADESGAIRDVKVLLAWRPQRGFDLEWKIAAGENSDKGQLSVAFPQWTETQTVLKTEGKVTRKQDGTSKSWTLSGTLTRTAEENAERIYGKLRAEQGNTLWTLEPDVQCTGEELGGQINVKWDRGSGRIFRCRVDLNAAPCDGITLDGENTVSLEDMELWEKAFVLRDAEDAFTRRLVGIMLKIPARDRALITHLMGKDVWTDGETVPVLPQDAGAKEEMPE